MGKQRNLRIQIITLLIRIAIISMILTGLFFTFLNIVFGAFFSQFFIALWPFVVAYFLNNLKEFVEIRDPAISITID